MPSLAYFPVAQWTRWQDDNAPRPIRAHVAQRIRQDNYAPNLICAHTAQRTHWPDDYAPNSNCTHAAQYVLGVFEKL